MRNLHIDELDEAKFDTSKTLLPLTATTFDNVTNDAVLAFGPTVEKQVIELRRRPCAYQDVDHSTTITSWDAPSPIPELACDTILSLQYFHESSTICVVLEGGDLVLVREKPSPDQERIEIVGSIDVGIITAQWSWNASTLALVTKVGALVLMSRDLEPISEVTMAESDLKMSMHVSVGWGKKETQFQGKRAKALKDPTMPDSINEGKSSLCDDGRTTISWRGDDAYVAVNTILASNRRVIRVYSADGILDSVSEPVDGLESALSWRPHGNLLASFRRTQGDTSKLEVVFFERNGLRHGQFDLRLSSEERTSLASRASLRWNVDSSILAVQMSGRLQLWTMGNYHYYLKQELRLQDLSWFSWHTNDPLRLLLSSSTICQNLRLDYSVDQGSTQLPYDYGMMMVIDGKKLKVTPLKHANVPPPMAYFEIEADENIIACASSRTCQRIVFLTHSYLYLCKLNMRQVNPKTSSIRHSDNFTLQRKDLSMFPRPTQVVVQHDDQVHLFSPSRNTSSRYQAFCHNFAWVNANTQNPELMTEDVQVPRVATHILIDSNHEKVFFRAGDEIIEGGSNESSTLCHDKGGYTTILTHSTAGQDHSMAISLCDEQLRVDGVCKAQQVTSFACTSSHIAYTTANHLLKFIHVAQEHEMVVPGDTPEVDERCRAVERGAKIVTIIPSTYGVVLQMPRGNLETIFPRILVLTGIRQHISDLRYLTAFTACRIHQVDMNILYDHDPQLWLDNVGKFVEQLKKPGRIDEFLQKLREEDVTKTLYQDTAKLPAHEGAVTTARAITSSSSKVNIICEKLILELQRRSTDHTPNIITAHVCRRPPNLNAALKLVSDLHQQSVEEADIAISHLCFLTDTNRLFDAALALYDLNLTLLVAQNAQRDPREYMPFLQNLQSLSDLRRRYTIDNHLRNYSKALESLHALNEHEECESYMVKHTLYTEAEVLYRQDLPHLQVVIRLHAEVLVSKSQHTAAATLYESLSDYNTAFPLYALAHHWRESLSCAALVPVTTSELTTLARSLAITCVEENRDYRAAATIHLDYLSDPVAAAELFCKSSYFAEAMRVLSMPAHNLVAQIPSVIDPALSKKFGEILELVADCQSQLQSQIPRIEELRVKKAEDPLAFYGGDAALLDGADIPDNVSLAPTDASTLGGRSMFTRYGGGAGGSQASTKFAGTVASNVSRKTSKTRRKEERKRAQGKKGSIYEEEYLISSVVRLIERVNGTHEEVRRLISGLRRRALREQASKVDEVMAQIQSSCDNAKAKVWPEAAKEAGSSSFADDGQGRPPGAEGIFYDGQEEPQGAAPKDPPTIKVWNK